MLIKTTNKHTIQLLCLVLLALLCLTGSADARSSTDNAEIHIGDVLFQGEQNLNFSAFAKGGVLPGFFATPDGTQTISLSGDGKGSISVNQQTGLYYAYYSGTADPAYNIRIMNLASSLGSLKIDIAGSTPDGAPAAENAADVHELVNDIGICYYFSGGAADTSGIHQAWYTYTITYGDGTQATSVKNTTDVVVELNKNNNPSVKDTDLAFRYKDNTNTGSAIITFKTHLNGLAYTVSASHTLIPSPAFAITPAKNAITAGETTTLTLRGKPYENYNLQITPIDGTNGIYFPQTTGGWVHYQEINAYPNWNGTKIISITAGRNINQTYYTINASKGGEVRTTVISVEKLSRTLTLTAPADAAAGLFASGDTIKITCSISSPQAGDTGSLYLSGANMAENLLTVLDLSSSAKEYYFSTRGLDAGTYTLILKSSDGKTADKRISFYLSEPSIHLTIGGGDYATLVQGAELNLSWRARGSPAVSSATDTTGEVRWYIFGTNFHLAGHSLFPITNSSIGTAAPQGQAKSTYDKTLTEGLDTGTYTVLIEHPGADNTFTLSADAYDTTFSSVTTAWGDTIPVGNMQTSNAVATVESLLTHSQSDDLYVLTEFSVEKPWLAATDISDAVIGNTLKIEGETNYPAGKAVSLTIRPISFDVGTNANTAMKISVPADVTTSSDTTYNKRTFNFSGITTDTWYPGTYAAKISLAEYNASLEMTFIVGVDGQVSSADLKAPLTYSGAYESTSYPAPADSAAPAPTAQPIETIPLSSSTPAAAPLPAETTSPAPLLGAFAGLLAAAYFRRH